jgi:hypothetical protein
MNPPVWQRRRRGTITLPLALVPADLTDAGLQYRRATSPAHGFKGSGEAIAEAGQSA